MALLRENKKFIGIASEYLNQGVFMIVQVKPKYTLALTLLLMSLYFPHPHWRPKTLAAL